MKIEKLEVYPRLQETTLYCVPARIRKCDGFVLEALTLQPHREIMFELMKELMDEYGYHIYSLRHKEDDMSDPHYVTKKGILVNRFGWFMSKDIMKFKSVHDEIRITTRNSHFYDVSKDDIEIMRHHGCCRRIPVLKYFKIEDSIF